MGLSPCEVTEVENTFRRSSRRYVEEKGIKHELSVVNLLQQNAVAERMNCTLMEAARTMISHAGLTNSVWAETVFTAS